MHKCRHKGLKLLFLEQIINVSMCVSVFCFINGVTYDRMNIEQHSRIKINITYLTAVKIASNAETETDKYGTGFCGEEDKCHIEYGM